MLKDILEATLRVAAPTEVTPNSTTAPSLEPDIKTSSRYYRLTGNFPTWQLELPLFGRDQALAVLREHLRTAHRVMLTGAGGIGKTKLAAVLADTSTYPGGVVWYRLPPADSTEKAAANLENLNVLLREHLYLPPTAAADAVWHALGQSQTLLVLDNAEDCEHPEPYITRLNALDVRHGTAVLVTSRYTWNKVRNVVTYPLEDLAPEYAARLFQELAHRAVPKQALGDADVAGLVNAARNNPRLLTVAAPLLQTNSIQEVTQMLRQLKGDELEEAVREMVQRTLELIERQPNGPAALAAMARLVVFRGGFDDTAAKVLLGEDLNVLRTLLVWNLIRFDGSRYDTDPMVREVIRPDATAYPVHLDYYQALAKQHHEKQDYVGLDPESSNLEAAFEWAMSVGETAKAYWLANTVSPFLQNRGRFEQELNWLQQVEAALPVSADPALRAILENQLANSYAAQPLVDRAENLRRAIGAFENALRHSTEAAAPLDYAVTQRNLGRVYQNLAAVEDRGGNLRQAIGAYGNALRHFTEATAPLEYAMTQNNLGMAYNDLAQIENREENLRRAIGAYENALRYYTAATAPLDYAMIQNNLGASYLGIAQVEDRYSNLQRAIAAYEAALLYFAEGNSPLQFVTVQCDLGLAYKEAYDFSAAVECWEKAESVYRQMGDITNVNRMRDWINGINGGSGFDFVA